MHVTECQSVGDLTEDASFKFFFKDPSLKSYVATIISDMLNLDFDYVFENMKYLDIEFPKNIQSLMRSDCVIKIDNTILIFEMNKYMYSYLVELKIRYANYIFDKMFLKVKKKYMYNGTRIILVMINVFDSENAVSTYKPLNEYGKVLTKYIEVKEYNLANIKENWYNKFTISKCEKYLLYLLMSREKLDVVAEYVKGDDILSEAEKNRIDLMNGKICLDYDVEIENEIVKQGLMEVGRKEGISVGRAEGISVGRAEGISVGRTETNRDNAKKMKENGIAIDLISKITGLTKKQISLL